MFDTVEQVDWKKYKGAFHLSQRLPDMIRQMASCDDILRQEARTIVFEEIFHQGTVYLATPHVVPFVVEMLGEDAVPDKADLLRLLYLLVESCNQAPGSMSIGSQQMTLYMATYRNISAGYPVYLRFLSAADSEMRCWTVMLLSQLLEHAPRTRGILRHQLTSDTDSYVWAAALYAFGKLAPEGYRMSIIAARTHYQAYLETVMREADDRLIQLAAASAWIQFQVRQARHIPETIPDCLLPILGDALVNPISEDDACYLEFSSSYKILWNCSRLGVKWLIELMRLPQLGPYQVHYLAREMLDQVFAHRQAITIDSSWEHFSVWLTCDGWNEPADTMMYRDELNAYHPSKPLTTRQQHVLAAILDDNRFWQLPTNLLSFFYDLPNDRASLQRLLG